MDYDKYIFLDYENIQDINVNIIIDEKIQIVIIIRKDEIKIPVELIIKTQPFGNSIEWLQIKNNGNKNAFYFFVVYFLGHYIFNQGNKEFIIYSKNKDYDPLIEYLRNINIKVKRIENLKQINEKTKKGFLKKKLEYISVLWKKLAVIQKIFFTVIIIAIIVSLVVLHTPQRTRTTTQTTEIAPWAIFDEETWTITDFERENILRKALVRMITSNIKTINGIDDANLILIYPEKELFNSDQKPITATLILTPKSGSDVLNNRRIIEGIQRILKIAVEGLDDENIIIVDQNGSLINR